MFILFQIFRSALVGAHKPIDPDNKQIKEHLCGIPHHSDLWNDEAIFCFQ